MPIRFSREAEEDLIQIYLAGIANVGESHAEHYMSGLRAIWLLLESNPKLTYERTDYTPPVRIHPYKSHVVIYSANEDGVIVLRVRHGAEDWASDPIDANDQ